MKVRVKFSKYGAVKFIGHLDVMRYFQKAIRRAQIDIRYSEGFNPHQIMSFASPLGVGYTSDGEYVDLELNSYESLEQVKNDLNAQMNEGFFITEVSLLKETPPNTKQETAMSLVAAADYLVSLKDGYDFAGLTKEAFETKFTEFMRQDSIVILKKTKKSEREMDIKPYLLGYSFRIENNQASMISHADFYENGIRVFLKVSAGSVINIKPELVMESFAAFIGSEMKPFAFQMHRMETYGDVTETKMSQIEMIEFVKEGKTFERTLVPLSFIGAEQTV